MSDVARSADHRAGFVALIGRPNVGKSTLLNRILGRKLAIVTPKPQTTRTRILGIETRPNAQLLFVDTPGLHEPRTILGARMVRVAQKSLAEADVGLWVIDGTVGLNAQEEHLAREIAEAARPLVIVLNKIDAVKRANLLVLADRVGKVAPGRPVVPVSAMTGENLPELLRIVEQELPVSPPLFPADSQTDLPERFFVAELVREQLLLATHEEVPYQSAVAVESFTERPGRDLVVIEAQILVARSSQKAIVLGEKGSRLKSIGAAARHEIERFLGVRVYLQLFVKVDPKWLSRETTLTDLGL